MQNRNNLLKHDAWEHFTIAVNNGMVTLKESTGDIVARFEDAEPIENLQFLNIAGYGKTVGFWKLHKCKCFSSFFLME